MPPKEIMFLNRQYLEICIFYYLYRYVVITSFLTMVPKRNLKLAPSFEINSFETFLQCFNKSKLVQKCSKIADITYFSMLQKVQTS